MLKKMRSSGLVLALVGLLMAAVLAGCGEPVEEGAAPNDIQTDQF